MADDAITSSSLLVVPIEDENIKKPPINVNVSQWPREKKSIENVLRTRVVQSMWDHHLLFNPHIFSIYLELIFALGIKFDECQHGDDDIHVL
jgi:hypothetical protein